MYNKELKIGISALIVVLAIALFFAQWYGTGVLLIVLAGLVVLTIFRNEHILTAFYYLRKQQMPQAKQALDRIKNPHKLIKTQEAYFYYLNGIIAASQKNSITQAEKFFSQALKIGLRMEQDQAVAKLNMAVAAASKRRKVEAQKLIAEAKKLDKNRMLSDQIKMIEGQLKFL